MECLPEGYPSSFKDLAQTKSARVRLLVYIDIQYIDKKTVNGMEGDESTIQYPGVKDRGWNIARNGQS